MTSVCLISLRDRVGRSLGLDAEGLFKFGGDVQPLLLSASTGDGGGYLLRHASSGRLIASTGGGGGAVLTLFMSGDDGCESLLLLRCCNFGWLCSSRGRLCGSS